MTNWLLRLRLLSSASPHYVLCVWVCCHLLLYTLLALVLLLATSDNREFSFSYFRGFNSFSADSESFEIFLDSESAEENKFSSAYSFSSADIQLISLAHSGSSISENYQSDELEDFSYKTFEEHGPLVPDSSQPLVVVADTGTYSRQAVLSIVTVVLLGLLVVAIILGLVILAAWLRWGRGDEGLSHGHHIPRPRHSGSPRPAVPPPRPPHVSILGVPACDLYL